MRMENFTKNISISMYRTLNIYILSVIYLFLIGCNKPIPKKALKLELENIKKVERYFYKAIDRLYFKYRLYSA